MGVAPLMVFAYYALMVAAIAIFVAAVVRISHSFDQISRALTDIATTLRRKNQ
jgi:uncharacterized protein YoxC